MIKLPQDITAVLLKGSKSEAVELFAKEVGRKEALEAVDAYLQTHPEIGEHTTVLSNYWILLPIVLFVTFGWALVNFGNIHAGVIVLLHLDSYEQTTYTVNKIVTTNDNKGPGFWGFEGKLLGREMRLFAPELADMKVLHNYGVRKLFPPGTVLDVWYSPDVTSIIIQGRSINVIPYTPNLKTAEIERIMWWVIYCFLPFVIPLLFFYSVIRNGNHTCRP